MANIIVAGGAGFIGSHLSARLIQDGHSVICLDNLITGAKSNNVRLLENPNFSFYDVDVTNPLLIVPERFGEVHYIFHLASPASPSIHAERSYINFPVETLLVNSIGTHNLLELAKQMGARFLFASTSEVYGNPSVSPQPETYYGNVNPNGIRSMYDEGKRFGEAMTMVYVRKYDLDARIIRIFNTYGPNMQKDDGRVVSNFINQALQNQPMTIYGDGTQTRSFCYVDDMIEGLSRAIFTDRTKGEVINLGNPDERKILEIATIIKDMVGASVDIVHERLPEDDPLKRKPDISKAKELLQWEPKISLEEGLQKTIDYFRSA
jgi:nucleoside-diphosphate-sugar epimerase